MKKGKETIILSDLRFFTLGPSGNRIAGIAELPDTLEKYPVVVMLHGFTGDHITSAFKFPRLSRRLVERGIATVRFDFRGSGDSEGCFEEMSPLTELEDAKEVLGYIRKQPFYNGMIGIVGYSLGGMVAVLLGPTEPDVTSMCLWSPAVLNLQLFRDHVKNFDEHLDEEGFFDVGGIRISKKFRDGVMSVDASEELARFQGKVLIVHGTNDESVPFESVRKYAERNGFCFHAIEGGDHRFSRYEWVEELIDITSNFFNETLLSDS
ncbi:MAG: uncharacterized protein PWP37_149 [Thermotogota bacterium]|nr:uncharacterized protein [Thermotogota bacterium]